MWPGWAKVDDNRTSTVLAAIWLPTTGYWLECQAIQYSYICVLLHQAIGVLRLLARLCQIHNTSLDQLLQVLIKRLHAMRLTRLNG